MPDLDNNTGCDRFGWCSQAPADLETTKAVYIVNANTRAEYRLDKNAS